MWTINLSTAQSKNKFGATQIIQNGDLAVAKNDKGETVLVSPISPNSISYSKSPISSMEHNLREFLDGKYDAHRIDRDGYIHVKGIMPNSNTYDWYLLGHVASSSIFA